MKKKMFHKEIVSSKAHISYRYLDYILNSDRDASPSVAKRLERATKISKVIWTFGSKRERQQAWTQFVRHYEATA